MSFIYVYTNDYFNHKNTRKIGSTLNPYIRLKNYITYYQDEGMFEYLFKLDCKNPYTIDGKIKNVYLLKHNTHNNGSTGGTEIYDNIDIRENIIKCFTLENIDFEELDPSEPPITKKYSNNIEKETLIEFKKDKLLNGEDIIYNKYKYKNKHQHKKQIEIPIQCMDMGMSMPEEIIPLQLPPKQQILDEISEEYNGDLIERTNHINNELKFFLENINSNSYFILVEEIKDFLIVERDKYGGNTFDELKQHNKYFVGNPEVNPVKYILNTGYHLKTDKVAIFNVPITNYKCSLNEIGRKKYGKMDELIFTKESKVGTKYGYIDLPEIRKSRYLSSIFEFEGEELEEIIIGNLKNIVPIEKQDMVFWSKKLKYTVLEYREGDFFSEHSDHKISKNHYGTLLIFPPAINKLEHKGGDFVIETDDCDLIIPSDINKNWKFIAFKTEQKHACHKIISGRRLVIKVELLYKKITKPIYKSEEEIDKEAMELFYMKNHYSRWGFSPVCPD
jgi:hypothetical protein